MKTIELLSLLIAVFLLQGCSSKSDTAKTEDTPEIVITDFIESVKSNKADHAKALCHPDLFEMIAPKTFKELFQQGQAKVQELDNYTITEMSNSGYIAKYNVLYTFKNSKDENDIISLKNENDKWLIIDI